MNDAAESHEERVRDLGRAYAAALLRGDEIEAEVAIREALEAKLSTAEIDDEIIAPALWFVGELWQRGEISVAKNLYVDTRSGWFSCRSVCYLAAGLPVVVQDTGFSEFLPPGVGLLAFSNGVEAIDALREVASNYEHHQHVARDVAREHFATDRVLGQLLVDVGLQ